MDWCGSAPVVLVLVCLRVALSYVEPPTNVTFHCHNLHNVLRWSYNRDLPGLQRFNLFIGSIQGQNGYPKDLSIEPSSREKDLSFLSDPNNEYYLELSAVGMRNESASAKELTFSYFKDSLSTQICSVDLPPVNVTALPDAYVQLQFTHPWMLYHKRLSGRSNPKHRKRASDSYDMEVEDLLPEFSYTVTMDENQHRFFCEKQMCEEKLPVDTSQQKHCLTVVGELEKMRVKGTQAYCTAPFKTPIGYILTIILSCGAIGILIAGLIFCMVYKKKTTPPDSLQTNLFVPDTQTSILRLKQEEITVPEVEPTSPTCLLPEFTFVDTPETTDDHVLPLEDDDGVVDDIAEVSNEEPGYKAFNLDGDEFENSNQTSGYERRPHVREPTA